jgi:hypothetical protein
VSAGLRKMHDMLSDAIQHGDYVPWRRGLGVYSFTKDDRSVTITRLCGFGLSALLCCIVRLCNHPRPP